MPVAAEHACPRPLDATEPESRRFESARLTLHYLAWLARGDEEKPALVLVHGGRDHARSWDLVARALGDAFSVYALDLRGHGDSDWAAGGAYEIADHVADLARLVEVIHRGPVSLVAHSMGGRIALDFAGAFPDRVARLVAIEGFGWRDRAATAADERLRAFVGQVRDLERRRPHVYASLEEAQARMRAANGRLAPDLARHLTVHAVRAVEGGYTWKFDPYVRLRPVLEWTEADTRALWAGIRAPVLLVWGTESALPLPLRDTLARLVPGARSISLERAGHWVHHDDLDRFVALARAFLLPAP